MATTDFGVVVADVLRKLPIDGNQISATSEPISTGDIEEFIAEGSSKMAGVLSKGGRSLDELDDDSKKQMGTAVEAYAVAESFDALGITGRDYQHYHRKWASEYDRYNRDPNLLTKQRSRMVSNIDTSSCKPKAEFIDTDYKF